MEIYLKHSPRSGHLQTVSLSHSQASLLWQLDIIQPYSSKLGVVVTNEICPGGLRVGRTIRYVISVTWRHNRLIIIRWWWFSCDRTGGNAYTLDKVWSKPDTDSEVIFLVITVFTVFPVQYILSIRGRSWRQPLAWSEYLGDAKPNHGSRLQGRYYH